MPLRGRIHIVPFLLALLLATPLLASSVPVINGNGWTTRIMLLSGTFQCPAQQLLPPPPVITAPAYVDASCLGAGVSEASVDGYADLFYRGATTSHVKVDPLSDLATAVTVGPAVCNDEQGTWINLLSDGPAFATVTVRASDGTVLWNDIITFTNWTQVAVKLRFGIIFVTVEPSNGFGFNSPHAIRGFVSYGLRDGGSDVVLPLK